MATNVLVLGGTGMLGHTVASVLEQQKDLRVRATQRTAPQGGFYLDASSSGRQLEELLTAQPWDYVINCIGLTRAASMADAPAAEMINARFPHRLAQAAGQSGFRLIHISTDGVFSGRNGPYDESSAADPEDVYGKTKLAGESGGPDCLVLRCSIIGPDPLGKRGLFEWFRAQPAGARIPGYTDHLWDGVTTRQFADLCRLVISERSFDRLTARSPLRHFCPNRPITKSRLLEIFKEKSHAPATVHPEPSGRMVNRVLTSRWGDFIELFGHDLDVADAVAAMLDQAVKPPTVI